MRENWQPRPDAVGAQLDNPPQKNASLPYAGSATAFRMEPTCKHGIALTSACVECENQFR